MEDLIKLFGNVLDEHSNYEHEKGWAEDVDGSTAVHAAAKRRDAAIGEFLVALGVVPAQQTERAVSA